MKTISLIFSLSLPIIIFPNLSWAHENLSNQDLNLTKFTYPNHTCGKKQRKPNKPERLNYYDNVEDYNAAIAEYNIEVTEYNKTIKTYKSCINQYIKNGNQFLNNIRKKLNATLKEARSN